jgi:hypothetical protein
MLIVYPEPWRRGLEASSPPAEFEGSFLNEFLRLQKSSRLGTKMYWVPPLHRCKLALRREVGTYASFKKLAFGFCKGREIEGTTSVCSFTLPSLFMLTSLCSLFVRALL